MGRQKTISLTRVSEDNYLEPLLNSDYRYDANIAQRCAIKRDYFEQRQLVEKIYRDKFVDFSSQLIEGVESFAEKCINIHDTHLFGYNRAENLFGAILILDMRISDLEPTFDLVEKRLKKFKNLNVFRIKANLLRKKNFLDLLEPSKHSKRVFIIIEQAETLDRATTDIFVGHLRNRILDETSPSETVMILFCLSIQIQQLPFTHLNCFGRMEQIITDKNFEEQMVKDELIRGRKIKLKLAHEPLNNIWDLFVNVDASLANIVYMYNHALFEHYNNLERDLVETNKNVDKPHKLTQAAGDNHQYICDQMYYYLELLKDEGMYPEDVIEIYEQLVRHEDLGKSREFVDAVLNLRKFPHEAVLRRIDSVIRLSEQNAKSSNDKNNLVSVLKKYREMISDNKGSDGVITDLINKLLDIARSLKNPIRCHRQIYFRDSNALINAALTASRGSTEFKEHLADSNSYFGMVFDQVLMSNAQVGANDLYNDVIDKFKEMIRLERSQNKLGSRIKSTPKKRDGRRVTQVTKTQKKDSHKVLSEEEEDGIAKALFVDVVDCMEVHCMIKLDPKAKGKLIKRLIWLSPDEE